MTTTRTIGDDPERGHTRLVVLDLEEAAPAPARATAQNGITEPGPRRHGRRQHRDDQRRCEQECEEDDALEDHPALFLSETRAPEREHLIY